MGLRDWQFPLQDGWFHLPHFLRKLVDRAIISVPAAHRFISRLARVWGLTTDKQRGFASDRNYSMALDSSHAAVACGSKRIAPPMRNDGILPFFASL